MITTKNAFILLGFIAAIAIWRISSLADSNTAYIKGLEYYNRNEYLEAVKYFRKAAEQGYTTAQKAMEALLRQQGSL